MNKLKKIFSTIFLLFVLAFSLPISVFANAPDNPDYLTVSLSKLPEDAVYADLLIKIDEKDSKFVDFGHNEFADSVSDAKEIVEYSDDGYRSFTFHYENAKANIKIKKHYENYYSVDFCNGSEYQEYETQYEDLRDNYGDIKIAILDKDFNIIAVSKSAQLPDEDGIFAFLGDANYDFNTNSLEFDTQFNPYFIAFSLFSAIIIIIFSISVEVLVGLFFGFMGKRTFPIIIVNACSQIVMRVLYMVLPFAHSTETIILEILVYCVEFMIYKKCFKDSSTVKIFWYTVIANTLSLLAGIYFENYFLV